MKRAFFVFVLLCVSLYAAAGAFAADDYWNDEVYANIEQTVYDNVPTFPSVDFVVTEGKYAELVADMEEEYFVSDGANGHTKMTQTVKDYTKAIQTAIDDANAAGGGRVVVPAAEGATSADPTVYYTGSIEIKSNVNLYLAEGTELRFVRNISNKYYPMVLTSFEGNDTYNYAAPIRAFHAKNIALTGKGTLNPQADFYNWWPWKSGINGFPKQSTVVDVLVKEWSDKAVAIERRLLTDGSSDLPAKIPTMTIDWDDIEKVEYIDTPTDVEPLQSLLRPCTIEPYACENILLEGVRIINSPMWEVHPLRCRNVLVRGLEIDSHGNNNDGVDPESTHYVIIEDCSFSTGDDCIAIKSGKNRDGYNRGQVGGESSGNIIVRNCTFADGHGGVTCGSECTGGISNVFAHNNSFDSVNLDQVLRFKTNSYRGGLIENIYFKDNTVVKCKKALMYGETQYTAGSAQDKEGDLGPYTPQLKGVYMSNIIAGSADSPVNATNAILWKAYERAPMTNIKVKDVTVYGVKNAPISLSNVKNFELENVQISLADTPAALETYNTETIEIGSVILTVDGEEYSLVEGTKIVMPKNLDKSKNAVISGTITTKDSAFKEGNGTVKAYLDRGRLEEGNKAPIITPYDAEIKTIDAESGKYSFTVSVPLTDKPDYQYPYRPETEAENMYLGNHIISIVATGLSYDQNTWNYNVKCTADADLSTNSGKDTDTDGDTATYWNDEIYANIEKTVKANKPTFPNVDFVVTEGKYAELVADMEEEYFVSDGANGHTKMTQTVKDYTKAIQTAIDDANAAGGGRVVIPAAEGATSADPTVYYTGSIEIKSNVNLYLAEGTELRFVRNISNKYYPMVLTSFEGNDTYNYAAPIRAFHAKNIALTGKGTLNPQADYYNWWPWKSGINGFPKQSTVVDVLVKEWSDQAVPVSRRLLTDGVTPVPAKIPTMTIDWDDIEKVEYIDTPTDVEPLQSLLRPCTIEPYACENILLEGVRIINSPMWEVHPLRCRNVLVRGLEIDSHGNNNDGVDPESTHYVIIEDCSFSTGDDCIAIKSGKNRDGYNRGQVGGESSGNIIVRNCTFADGHGGVTCGSECTGGISNVFAHDNHFDSMELQQVLRFKTNSYRGGLIENIYFRDNTVAACSNALMYGETQYTAGSAQDKEGDLGPYTPQLKGVYMSNIIAGSADSPVNAKNAILWKAYERAPMTNIKVKDVTVYGVKNAVSLSNVKNFELENVQISLADTPAALETYNTETIEIGSVILTADGEEYSLVEGTKIVMPDDLDKSKDAVITGIIITKDSAFKEGKGTVNAYLDRGRLEEGNKAPIVTPYPAEVEAISGDEGKYSFTVSIPLTDKPDYQYAYRPETEAENMYPGNHIISIVATGLPYDQNTWNYNVKCTADADIGDNTGENSGNGGNDNNNNNTNNNNDTDKAQESDKGNGGSSANTRKAKSETPSSKAQENIKKSEVLGKVVSAISKIFSNLPDNVKGEMKILPSNAKGETKSFTSDQLSRIISDDETEPVVLETMTVSEDGIYVFKVPEDNLTAGVKIFIHMLVADNTTVASFGALKVAETETNSAVFMNDSGEVIDTVPDDKDVNVAAYMEANTEYTPLVTQAADDENNYVGSSGGGCATAGFGIFGLLLAAFAKKFK